MEAITGPIEESVEMTRTYPSVTERYFTKYYYIPKEKKKPESSVDNGSQNCFIKEGNVKEEDESNCEGVQHPDIEDDVDEEDVIKYNPVNSENETKKRYGVRSPLNSSGHTCVMVHTNKLCLVTLSHNHPILAQKKEVTQVSYEVGKFNRLENQVSGKGKRGAQMMGPQSPVCVITCSDGIRYSIMAGIHGKLVEVNERLLRNPGLVREQPDAEGYLAVVLPPLRSADSATAKLLTAQEYQCL